jgi:hypothetical protein
VQNLESSLIKFNEKCEFEVAKRIHVLKSAIKTLKSKFSGQGIVRDTDHIIFEKSFGKFPVYKVKFTTSSNGYGSNSLEGLKYTTMGATSSEDDLIFILKSIYLKLNSPPKKLEITAPLSYFAKFPFMESILPWLTRYFQQKISINLVYPKSDLSLSK